MNAVRLRLYVAAGTTASARISSILRQMIDDHLDGQADIEVIDVLSQPELAEAADVLATPTIDCLLPLPARRVVGIPNSAEELAIALVLSDRRPASLSDQGPHER